MSGVTTAFFSDFGCFGFFASRFDRFWPFAMTGSFDAKSVTDKQVE
jgi:hypothetical protein